MFELIYLTNLHPQQFSYRVQGKKLDVFVSFRGIDTRRTFVSHLMLSLFKSWITTFQHEEVILENQPLSPQVLQAIEESRIAIVVISKNYAASYWCLEELAKILECKKKRTMKVVPVFYEVDPSDVLKQVDDLGGHDDGDEKLEKVKRWKDALENLIEIYRVNYSDWETKDYSDIIDRVLRIVSLWLAGPRRLIRLRICAEFDEEPISEVEEDFPIPKMFPLSLQCLIEVIATTFRTIDGEQSSGVKRRPSGGFLDKQDDNYVTCDNLSQFVSSNDFSSFVGMDRLMESVYTLLDLESSDAIIEIGISGESGVGKTTLARCVYEKISPLFHHHYFINDTKNFLPGMGFLDDIALREESESLAKVVKGKLGHRKVLLIVDNMFDFRLFKIMRNISRWFGRGSRLIFVTRDEPWLVHCGVERRYVVESLRYDEALQLFSLFAFKQEQVPREYYQLSVRAVTIAGCIPLALKVFGTFLYGKYIDEWERELCRLEASRSTHDCVGKVSGYIRDALS